MELEEQKKKGRGRGEGSWTLTFEDEPRCYLAFRATWQGRL
jgi:hypothetical protein